MKKNNYKNEEPASLRERAQRRLAPNTKILEDMSSDDVQKLIEELQIHQVELELQNEELRRAQSELQQTRDKYYELFDFAPVGYFILDKNGLITEVNLSGADLLGYTRKYLLRNGFSQLVAPDDQDTFFHHCKGVYQTPGPQSCELRLERKDGAVVHAQLTTSVARDPEGDENRLRIVVTDITAARQAKRAISELQARIEENELTLEALMEFIPDGIAIASAPDVNILRVSHYGLEMTGKPVEMLAGIGAAQHAQNWDIYEKNGKTLAQNENLPLARAVRKGEIVKDEELVLGRPDGSRVPVLCNAGPILDEAGKILGGIVVWRDITSLKQAEKTLRVLNQTLERRVAGRTAELEKHTNQLATLTSELEDVNRELEAEVAAHKIAALQIRDLNRKLIESQETERLMIARELHDSLAQELIAANMQCELLLRGRYADSAAWEKHLKKVSGILLKTIAAVRNLAYELRPAGLHQFGIVETLHNYCRDYAEMHLMPVDFQCAGFERVAIDDFTAINLYRLVQEGLLNIKKHADASRIWIRLVVTGQDLIVRINDNGKGFDVQQRLAALSSEKKLGLRSMQERINLLNGSMKIDSKPGRGTKLTLKIPFGKYHYGYKKKNIDC